MKPFKKKNILFTHNEYFILKEKNFEKVVDNKNWYYIIKLLLIKIRIR